MSFFANEVATATKTLTKDSNIVLAIDNSGSTSGNVLAAEIRTARTIAQWFENKTCIYWNSRAKAYKDTIPLVTADGGTSPFKFVELMEIQKIKCDFLVLFTDGQIESVDAFRNKLCSLNLDCPILVVLTIAYHVQSLSEITGCNMSIVEACLSASSNVAVCTLVATEETVRVFQATGYFSKFLNTSITTTVTETPVEQFGTIPIDDLWGSEPVSLTLLPKNVIKCDDGRFIQLDEFIRYLANPNFDTDQKDLAYALTQATSRTNLPLLQVESMIKALHLLNKAAEQYLIGDIIALQQELFRLLLTDHQNDTIAAIRAQIVAAKKAENRKTICAELQAAIQLFTSVLSAYKTDKSQFDYGSNRAAAARTIEDSELENIAKCVEGVCPVSLDTEPLGIFFTAPPNSLGYTKKSKNNRTGPLTDAEKKSIAKYFSRNIMIDCPALCGAAMQYGLTPGLYGINFAKSGYATINPITQQPLIGFLPLSFDMRVLIRHLSKVFCNGKEMPFLLRAYVAMVANHMASNKWASKELRNHATFVLNNLNVQCRFSSLKSQEPTTLADSIRCILSNMNYLNQISYGEAMSMICIAQQLIPGFTFDVVRAISVVQFVNVYRQVRDKYIGFAKQRRDPLCILQECFNANGSIRNTLHGKIAFAFASIHQSKGHLLRLSSFRQGLIEILNLPAMADLYEGKKTAEETNDLSPIVPAVPKDDPHFDLELWRQVFQGIANRKDFAVVPPNTSQSMIGYVTSSISRLIYGAPPPTQNFACPFCAAKFATDGEKWTHINAKLGPYNLDLTRILLYNRDALLSDDLTAYLQKRYGAGRVVIYSAWVSQQTRSLIDVVSQDDE